jgi:lipopolysaccharide transport system permease protein
MPAILTPAAPPPHTVAFPRRRDLWWQLTVRAIETRHRGSHLGMVWAVLNPLLMLSLYFVVFSLIFKSTFRGESPQYFALGVFLGLVLFHVVSETLGVSPLLIISQPNLVKKVVFPVELLPVAQLGAIWFHCGISLVLLLAGLLAFGPGLSLAGVAWLPLILAPLVLLTLGLAWFVSALGVFLRDITQIVPLLSQVLLWTSSVFFTPEAVQKVPLAWKFLKWNPLLHIVDLARDVLLWQEPVNLRQLGYAWAAGIAVFVVGRWFFRKLQPAFADVI